MPIATACGNYSSVNDATECGQAAAQLQLNLVVGYAGDAFAAGNPYTAGCYTNNGDTTLWFNPYGNPGVCVGPQDCKTICRVEACACVNARISLPGVPDSPLIKNNS